MVFIRSLFSFAFTFVLAACCGAAPTYAHLKTSPIALPVGRVHPCPRDRVATLGELVARYEDRMTGEWLHTQPGGTPAKITHSCDCHHCRVEIASVRGPAACSSLSEPYDCIGSYVIEFDFANGRIEPATLSCVPGL
jgi:hypothetical protein